MVMFSTIMMICSAVSSDGGDLVPSKVIVALFTAIFAAGGGIWIGNANGRRKGAEDAERRIVSGEVKVPTPMSVEQTAYQAKMKDNEHDHENLFARVAALEKEVAGIGAKVEAKFDALSEQLRDVTNMTRQLFERILGGKRK